MLGGDVHGRARASGCCHCWLRRRHRRCLSSSGSSGSAAAERLGERPASDCAGTGTQGGADLQIPDVEDGKFNVAMVLIGPHDDGGWSQAHYEGLQYLCQNVPDAHIAYIELVPEGADSEQVFRSLRARASTSSSAPRSATWTRWPRSPRSSRTSRSCT